MLVGESFENLSSFPVRASTGVWCSELVQGIVISITYSKLICSMIHNLSFSSFLFKSECEIIAIDAAQIENLS